MTAALDLTYLLSLRATAMVGGSEDHSRIGGQPLHSMTEFGYRGALYPANAKYTQIKGLNRYLDVGRCRGPAT